VDVTQALSELQYPSIDKNITISISDEFAEWNNGIFTLNINNGTGSCSRNPNSKADINIDIGALSQLAVGYRSAMELVNSNRMELNSEISVTDISKIFPEKTVFLTHRF